MSDFDVPATTLSALAERYEVFLLDQYGVLHDGVQPYPGVIDALQRLKAAGKRSVLLSNSGRRALENGERLTRLGLGGDLFDQIVTSGEVAWNLLAEGGLEVAENARCLLLSRGGDRSALAGLPLEETNDATEADVVLLSGSNGERMSLADYEAILAPAAAAGRPCLCTNPDKVMLVPGGKTFGAGRIAELYQSLGGQVTWIGKPYPEIYRFALGKLGDPPSASVVAIGDSLEHDVAGAKTMGCSAALVLSGIHEGEAPEALSLLARRHGAMPDVTLRSLAWQG